MDGGQRSRQGGVTDDTTTNHRQERWRCSDVGKGCSNSESGGKGKGVVATASVAVAVAVAAATAMAARMTMVIGAERVRMTAMAAVNAMVTAAATAVSTAAAKAALKWLSSLSEAAVVVRQCWLMGWW